jgi:hypothetical protein
VHSISSAVISLDMGTSSVRACLVDESLNILFQRSVNVRLESGLDGRAEQDAEEIIAAALTCLNAVSDWAAAHKFFPAGLCFSNAVASLVMLDEYDRPMAPALTWADTRAAHEAETLKGHLGVELYARTACPTHSAYWLPKIKWLKHSKQQTNATPQFLKLLWWPTLPENRYFLTIFPQIGTCLIFWQNRRWMWIASDCIYPRIYRILPFSMRIPCVSCLSIFPNRSSWLVEWNPA